MNPDAYLERIGVDPADIAARDDAGGPDRESVAALQRAHVTAVPFDTLTVTGDPFGPMTGGVPSLDPGDSVAKILDEDRGGWCFELNGALAWLLTELGADLDVLAARVVGEGGARPPANHRISLVHLDEPVVVDAGTGAPMLHRPLPLDGTTVTDATGHNWQVAASQRPDADYVTRYRAPGEESWTDRYVFTRTPRDRRYFAPTCEFLATAPESPFLDGPTLAIASEDGHRSLTTDRLEVRRRGEVVEQVPVDAENWHRLLREHFGITLPTE